MVAFKFTIYCHLYLAVFLLFLPVKLLFLSNERFASLEAKRKFRAPRTSPTTANQSTLDSSSVILLEHETLEASARETKNFATSVVDSKNWGSGPRPNSHVNCLNSENSAHCYCNHNVDGPSTEINAEEEKFGTNISHPGHYSEIAEKSMERFVSVISSFRCTSGSRVSGLRAPLKDVQSVCNNRPKTVDFRQYAYVPKQAKTSRMAPGK